MAGIAETWLQRLSRSSTAFRAAILTGFLMVVLLVCLLPVQLVAGPDGFLGLGISFVVCWLFAIVALFVGEMFRGDSAVMFQMCSGMMIRTFGPLFAAVFLSLKFPALIGFGFLLGLMFFYFASLAFETALLLMNVGPMYKKSGVNGG